MYFLYHAHTAGVSCQLDVLSKPLRKGTLVYQLPEPPQLTPFEPSFLWITALLGCSYPAKESHFTHFYPSYYTLNCKQEILELLHTPHSQPRVSSPPFSSRAWSHFYPSRFTLSCRPAKLKAHLDCPITEIKGMANHHEKDPV